MKLSTVLKSKLENRLSNEAMNYQSALNKKHAKEIDKLQKMYERVYNLRKTYEVHQKIYETKLEKFNEKNSYNFLSLGDPQKHYGIADVEFVSRGVWNFDGLKEKIKMDCDYHMTFYKPKQHGPVDLDIVFNKLKETYLPIK